MTNIEQMLRERIGLDPASVGTGSIHRAIRLRMKALSVSSVDEYGKRLLKSRAEWAELMESVVVTETWFFRDRDPFEAFVQFVQERLASVGNKESVRILSLPCASGEEAYSLVMALLDAGVPANRFQVDAADVSPRALLKARRAIYGRNSFRGQNTSFRDRYFHHTKEGYVLCAAVRTGVRFFEANVLSLDFLQGKGPYDVIFCRNLLIYFDRATQSRALSTVARLLDSNGLLIVGAAEQPLAFENGFASANIPQAFACRKIGAPADPRTRSSLDRPVPGSVVSSAHPVRRLTLPSLVSSADVPGSRELIPLVRPPGMARSRVAAVPRTKQIPIFTSTPPNTTPPATVHPVHAAPTLADAQRLADEGKFTEAAEICERCLRMDATSAHGWYLLGLIRDALADPVALECYRKALYLDPRHYETLLQMALVSEKAGDLSKARTFRRRAARIKPEAPPTTESARV